MSRDPKIKIRFDDPVHGWLPVSIVNGAQEIEIDASYITDCIGELAYAIEGLATGALVKTEILFHEEPIIVRLGFISKGSMTTMRASRSSMAGDITLIDYTGSTAELCKAFWRGFRDLESRFDERCFFDGWHYPFPSKPVATLTSLFGKPA